MARRRDEPVRLTRIYTRTGDAGETSLGDGSRVAKTDPRVAAVGAVEEVNAQLGLVLALEVSHELRAPLARIQNELFDLGADLAVPFAEGDERLRIVVRQVEDLEELCDRFNEQIEPLKSFVLPGGTEIGARLHLARTVCRRAELAALAVSPANPAALTYLNRLSDLLFILARVANAGGGEPLWQPGASRT
jgi:cob(I)alamin adenosyltransferase